MKYNVLDLFSGSGAASIGLHQSGSFRTVLAIDNNASKNKAFSNYDCEQAELSRSAPTPIWEIDVADAARQIPLLLEKAVDPIHVVWASFPCQDLSLAGDGAGLDGKSSSNVWHALQIAEDVRAPMLVLENVMGLATRDDGKHLKNLHSHLRAKGWQVAVCKLDAVHFGPQSRPRLFVVAVQSGVPDSGVQISDTVLTQIFRYHKQPLVSAALHPKSLRLIAENTGPSNFLRLLTPLPTEGHYLPPSRAESLLDILDLDEPFDDGETHAKRVQMMSEKTRTYFENHALKPKLALGTGFVRTRGGMPVLEVRTDGLAGCVRTGSGGSNRQVLVVAGHNTFLSRHFTPREDANLQGFPEDYELPAKLVARRNLVGDAVCVPVVRFLAERVLAPLLSPV